MYRHWPLGSLGSATDTVADRRDEDEDASKEDMLGIPALGRDVLLAVQARLEKGGEVTIALGHTLQW